MTPAEFCIKRPVATVMIFVSCLLLGGISSRLLPLEFFPEFDAPFLMIQMPYPGSTPRETERLLARPAEEALATLKGIEFLNSRSTPSGTTVFMLFGLTEDITVKAVEARELLEAIRNELPTDLRRINVFKFDTSDEGILTLRISSQRDLSESYEMLMRNLVRPIERLPGVARVSLEGVEPREIRIDLVADRVEALNIDLNELNMRLNSANFSASAGLINANNQRVRVNPVGEFQNLDEIRNLVINQRGVRLSDIADVTYEPRERDLARHLDQKYAIGIEVFKERGVNMVSVAERVLVEVEKAGDNPEMQGIQLFFLQNQAEGVKSSLAELLKAGLVGALLSIVVLYFFLRNVTTTLMVATAVPISLTIALGAMYLLGVSLNILSMMGLLLAVGMLVDNAVVVSEAIFTEREKQPNEPVKAAVSGVRSVGLAVFAGTATSMSVFLPNLFGEPDQISIFMEHVAIAICISLAASLVIAQTLIPLISSRVKPPSTSQDNAINRLKERYAVFLDWTLKHRWPAWGGIVLILASTAIPGALVKQDMFPETLSRELFLRYNLDGPYPLERIKVAVDKIENYLYDNKERLEINKVYSFYHNEGRAESTILLKDEKDSKLSSTDIKEMIREELPKIAIGSPSFDQQRSGGSEGVTVYIVGDSSERLAAMADDIIFTLSQIEGLEDIKTDQGSGDQEIQVSVDREKAAQYGLPAQQVATVVAVALRGTQLTEYRGPEGEVPVTLRFRDSDTQTVETLQTLQITTPAGLRIPLSSVVSYNVRSGPVGISRNDRETALTISATLNDLTMEEAREEIKRVLDQYQLPPGHRWDFGRGFGFEEDAQETMIRNILLAVLFIYLIMAALFESMTHPLSIVTGIVFSIVGVYWFFLLTGTTFSIMAFFGILILIGVVVNNGIVLVDHINQLRRRGMMRRAAVVQAGRDRIRPILMTVGTTVLGLIPLCISTTQIGGDGPPYFPMARAIVGGLVFSTVISLCVLPTIYVTLDDLRLWARDRIRQARTLSRRLLQRG